MKSVLAALLIYFCASATIADVSVAAARNSSCGCDVSNGTASVAADLNLDVIFIVDVSRAMDSRSLAQASAMVQSIMSALRVDPAFDLSNSTNASSALLEEFPWPDFMLESADFKNSSDFNATSTRQLFELMGEFWTNNSSNSNNTREFFEIFGSNLAEFWNNNSSNSNNTREFFEIFGSNLAEFWNNNSSYSNNTREFFEIFGSNLAEFWTNNSSNSNNTREFFEVFGSEFASFWTNSSNSNNTREFFEVFGSNLAEFWTNNSSNSNNTRELFEVFGSELASFWTNSSNSNNTREFFEAFGSNFASFLNTNGTGNSSRFGVIAVSDRAEAISDLSSVGKSINVRPSTVFLANVQSGISAAVDMFARSSARSARQLIYVITASDATATSLNPRFAQIRDLKSPSDAFKQAGGIITVTEVNSASPTKSLLNLASAGLYNLGFRDDVSVEVQMLCEANCS